jgi:hypothetical protein
MRLQGFDAGLASTRLVVSFIVSFGVLMRGA